MATLIGLVPLHPVALVGLMVSNNASCRRSKKAMVCNIVTGYAAHSSALKTALCVGRRNNCQGQHYGRTSNKNSHFSLQNCCLLDNSCPTLLFHHLNTQFLYQGCF